ncbi:lipopolysaccharide/colanic/teichoic acid biosynthesis glycosyltransferase [Bacillus tianshenii]|uniref:Lipopolysaccharide/colanic/teichoic acid biosynthesis glycosyltransferase n=1 Tax=Sutcliffiella tianshenii TaxID=1463404 RepID=A0ABS2NZA9_9BACI|nr:hypothetical protein [Bacillus tianshenii]MBM7619995.1 lipopolysaccharide/colanic/teichoic acid biosynthesis glycosyltransferase [Bacillus tianshenii]
MEILATVFGMLGVFVSFQLLLALLYLISRTAGNVFYRWVVHDLDFLMVLSFPLFGGTQYVASRTYHRFNWFLARLLLILFSILLLIVAVVFFILFSYFAEM